MAEIINGLNKIEQITLGEAVFGNGLNERLEQIDDNFQSIITSEYLKGDSGTSFGYAIFSNEDGFINPTDIYRVTTNNEEVLNVEGIKDSLKTTIGKDAGKFEFTFVYEIINGKKIAKSSLPFVYYDPSIYGISQDLTQGDCSCVIIYDNNEFKKLNAFPTIYYNKEDDKFYWKINGIETKLTATGPKGERGLAGAFNIVFARKDEKNESEYIIEKFLYQNPATNDYRWIDINDGMSEEDKNIAEEVLRPGSPCIALWGEGVETVNVETGENEITNIIVVGPIILHKEDVNDIDIYHVQVWDHMSIQHNMDTSLLKRILDNIDPQGALKGLYVPASKVGNTVEKRHAIFKDSNHNNILNIKYVDNDFKTLYTDSPTIDTNYNIECIGYGRFEHGLVCEYLDSLDGNSHINLPNNNDNDIDITSSNGISMFTGDTGNNGNISMYADKLWIQGDVTSKNIIARNELEVDGIGYFKNGTRFDEKSRIKMGFDLMDDISFDNKGGNNYSTTFNTPVLVNSSLYINSTITGEMDLSGVTITGSKKYQYVPIISDLEYSYNQDKTQLRITKFTIDPGNHIIYGIKFEVIITSTGSPSVKSYTYNLKPLNAYGEEPIDQNKTITFGTSSDAVIADILNPMGFANYLRISVLYDGFINSDDARSNWQGIQIYYRTI